MLQSPMDSPVKFPDPFRVCDDLFRISCVLISKSQSEVYLFRRNSSFYESLRFQKEADW